MSAPRPSGIEEYKEWLKTTLNINIDQRVESRYLTVATKVKADLEESTFWTSLAERLGVRDEQYYIDTGYRLLAAGEAANLQLLVKPYESILLKTFRRNVLDNSARPGPPDGDWYTPDNWFSRVKDTVRTLAVVKYLDGVRIISDTITGYCMETNTQCEASLEAREEGYYAAHLTIMREFDVPGPDWEFTRLEVPIEIQVTTQVQEVIRRLTHKYYEQRRTQPPGSPSRWQWNYKSEEFLVNYLGHILHYVEGMIMEVRDRQGAP